MQGFEALAPLSRCIESAVQLIDLFRVLVVKVDYVSPQFDPVHRLAPRIGVRVRLRLNGHDLGQFHPAL